MTTPVTFPPGWERLCAKPCATGSGPNATMGTVLLASFIAVSAADTAMTTSGFVATSSRAILGSWSGAPTRTSHRVEQAPQVAAPLPLPDVRRQEHGAPNA